MVSLFVSIAVCLGAEAAPATFTVTVPRELDTVHVEAAYTVSEPYLEISEGAYSDGVPGGLAGFVENLSVTRADGSAVTVEGPEAGRWKIGAVTGDAITVRYDVRLKHGDHRWPFGVDGIAYTRDASAFFVSHTILIVNESVRASRVKFVVPEGWRVATPWRSVEGEANTYTVANKLMLLEACVIAGDFVSREVRSGNTVVTLAIGNDLAPYADTLETGTRSSVLAYSELFQDTPQARFLAVLNTGGITDGSAYPNSVSMITPKKMEGANFVQAMYTLSHEILHLWNGYRLRPAKQMEWFREGFTDYLTWRTLVNLDLISEEALLTELRRQIGAYVNLNHDVSIAASGDDRGDSKNNVLVYEGGSLVALCLDAKIRERTENVQVFAQFMNRVYARTAMQNAPYDEVTLIAVATELAGENMKPFFDRYVNGTEPLPLDASLAVFGLRAEKKDATGRISVTVVPEKSPKGATKNLQDEYLGRN